MNNSSIGLNVQLVFFLPVIIYKEIQLKLENPQNSDLNRKSNWNKKMTKMKQKSQCNFDFFVTSRHSFESESVILGGRGVNSRMILRNINSVKGECLSFKLE